MSASQRHSSRVTHLSILLIATLKLRPALERVVYVYTLIQWFKVDRDLVITECVDYEISGESSYHSHSARSLCTSSNAPPTLARRTPPSFSLLARHFLILAPICSNARRPTVAPLSRISNSQDLVEAVTASLIDNRSEGRDERI